ncbi:hypothetical protein JY651_36905 [Pyxidicoccus parkwayensis]|uniref:Glycosyltransferase RgtA/B/C/D-like domain-containing protein n=1 Tax=Pyxidicoccus parkwayensis TaxID=2813578 RepID=A0ABX7NTC6_9BACT|nr:DUF6311 domain-containing protein [Pyxidicoccus parkwaysis]QSQ20770.1 hypothetical protein JY651_36905 [Pyxidicoccus parkwaysis]
MSSSAVVTENASPHHWERWGPWLGAGLGFLWFLALGGAAALDPTNLDSVGGGDHAQHVLGWLHFRNAPWRFPLGSTPSLLYPLSGSVAYTDSNPWVSLLLKPFSRWLPRDFQFIGPWFALCWALQGWMGVKLLECLTPGLWRRLLGASLFIMSPVLIHRTGHDTLCAHWLLLGMLWLHLRPRADTRAAWRDVGGALALNVLAAGVHPYLVVMVFTLTVALLYTLVARERRLSWRAGGMALAGVLGAVGLLFVVFGYVGQRAGLGGPPSFGDFGADVLTLINPQGMSKLVPDLPVGPGQYEGFGYLGTGGLALAGVLLFKPSRWWTRAREELRAHRPLVLAVLALALLAISTVVRVAGQKVLSMRGLTQALLPLLAPFRASGRFIWVLDYALLTAILALVTWRWRERPRVVTGLLLGAALLQFVDTDDLWWRGRFHGEPWPRLTAPQWEQVDPFYRHVVLYPPAIHDWKEPCAEQSFPENAYVRFGDLAYRKGMTTNSMYLARFDAAKLKAVCEALRADVSEGRFATDTLYVVDAKEVAAFQRPEAGLTCGVLDGYTVCVAAKEGRFREALMNRESP